MRGLTQSAALELERDAIRVNSISPGVVNTPLITEPLRPGELATSEHYSPEPFATIAADQPQA